MADVTLDNVFVLLCDWRGHIVWSSRSEGPSTVGDYSWANLKPESQERAKEAHGTVASLREARTLQVENSFGTHYRCWMWPLDSPEVAVCALVREVPGALRELSDRELECLELLAMGIETREIAERLDLSISTVHTHLKRSREKLNLPTIESLISFAARYCYPRTAPFAREAGD